MVTRLDYNAEQVAAAKSVLIELTRILGEYREHIVLVGGWIPELLLPSAEPKHVGSLDIDLAIDHRTLPETGYRQIEELLVGRGYRKDDRHPYKFYRTVPVGARSIEVEVDLLAGEYGGTGKSHRMQRIQDVLAHKARGADLAFDLTTELKVSGKLPNGAEDSAMVRVASIVAFLVMKGMALEGRVKEKDAYDIYFCVKQFPGGVLALAEALRPHSGHGLVKEGLGKIAEKFASPKTYGPMAVADFEQVSDPDERDLLTRDASEQVNSLLKSLGIRGAKA